jgi:hypothetical protein
MISRIEGKGGILDNDSIEYITEEDLRWCLVLYAWMAAMIPLGCDMK